MDFTNPTSTSFDVSLVQTWVRVGTLPAPTLPHRPGDLSTAATLHHAERDLPTSTYQMTYPEIFTSFLS